MTEELIYKLVLGKKYHLQEIYDIIEDYCINNDISDWKHIVRSLLEERNGCHSLGKYEVHAMAIALIQLVNERQVMYHGLLRN